MKYNNSPQGFGVVCALDATETTLKSCIIKYNSNTLGFIYISGSLKFLNCYILPNGIIKKKKKKLVTLFFSQAQKFLNFK